MSSGETPMDIDTTTADNKFNFHFPEQLMGVWQAETSEGPMKRGVYNMSDVRRNLGEWSVHADSGLVDRVLATALKRPVELLPHVQNIPIQRKQVVLAHLNNKDRDLFRRLLQECGVTQGLPVTREEFSTVLSEASIALGTTNQRQGQLASGQAVLGQQQAVLNANQQHQAQATAAIGKQSAEAHQGVSTLANATDQALRTHGGKLDMIMESIKATNAEQNHRMNSQDGRIEHLFNLLENHMVQSQPVQPIQDDVQAFRQEQVEATPDPVIAKEKSAGIFMTKNIVNSGDVSSWVEIIAEGEATNLIRDLQQRYMNGIGRVKPGDKILHHYFEQLCDWIRVAERVTLWQEMDEMVSLGNRILTTLRMQTGWIDRGLKMADIITELEVDDNDRLSKAMLNVEKKKRPFTWKKPSRPLSGNGRGDQTPRKQN